MSKNDLWLIFNRLVEQQRCNNNSKLTNDLCVSSRWFCHVDDDNYVILPSLLQLLSSYHHSQDVYLGRPSLDHPIEAAERVKSDGSVSQHAPYEEFIAPLTNTFQVQGGSLTKLGFYKSLLLVSKQLAYLAVFVSF